MKAISKAAAVIGPAWQQSIVGGFDREGAGKAVSTRPSRKLHAEFDDACHYWKTGPNDQISRSRTVGGGSASQNS